MSKAAEMAKVSVKGSFHIFWGLVASTIISAVGTILVARLLAPSEYGLYAIALVTPSLIQYFRDWGVNVAIIKYSAQYNSENQTAKVKSILVSGLLFETVLGLSLSVLSLLLSDFLATTAFQRPTITPLIQIASFSILTGAFLNSAQAAFTGIEKMELNSITLIVQSTIKTILIPSLVILGLGAFGAIIGYTVSFLIAGLTGLLLMWIMYKSLPKHTVAKLKISANIKKMFKYGLPLSIATILGGFLVQFYNFLLAIYATDVMIGNYTVATNFSVLVTFFATPVTIMMFPAFSKLDPEKDPETLKRVFQFSVKYASLLVVPSAATVMVLSQPAVSTLFGVKYGAAPLFLSLLAITYLYSAFGNLSTVNLINGQGQTVFNMKLTLLTAAIGFPLGFILISKFGVLGLITTSLTAGIPSLILSLRWIKQNYNVTVDWISSAKILLSSAIAAIITYALTSQLRFSSWITLIIGILVFLPVSILAILLTRAIDRFDINNLREMLSTLGPLSGLINYLLNVVEKIMNILRL
jgi:O-antigen/teichoic acid export membrane protein